MESSVNESFRKLNRYRVLTFISDFDRRELLCAVLHHADVGHVADIDSSKAHGRAHAQAVGVVEIRFQLNLGGEQPAGTAHEKNQDSQA